MKFKVFLLFVSVFLVRINQCKSPEIDLCSALQLGEENLRSFFTEYLEKTDMNQEPEVRFEQIKTFLQKQNCVEKAEFASGYLRTAPPIKQLFLKIASESKMQDVTINFSVENKKLSIEKIIINKSL